MLAPSSIADSLKDYIKEKLRAVEQLHRVRVLLAIESGSRAWGFPSLDSDYDVRFIYTHPVDHYVSIINHRDVIELPTIHDTTLDALFDLNGWDIRKTLQLALKSNPVLIEWLASPIVYIRDDHSVKLMSDFIQETVKFSSLIYHYQRIAHNAWLRIQQAATVKLYCYALRASIVIRWINKHETTPPMDMNHLCNSMEFNHNFNFALQKLISTKLCSKEGDVIPRNQYFDEFIVAVLDRNAVRPTIIRENLPDIIKLADQVFHKIIGFK